MDKAEPKRDKKGTMARIKKEVENRAKAYENAKKESRRKDKAWREEWNRKEHERSGT
jgi:hypothetical protein